jgi:hypothetical protein
MSVTTRNVTGTVLAILAIAVAWALPAGASADSAVLDFSVIPSNTQAGGHPDISTKFILGNYTESGNCCGDAKDVTVSMPAGMTINPTATPHCTSAQFASESCPPDSQVGFVQLYATVTGPPVFFWGLYNLVARPGEPGSFAFSTPLFRTPQYIVAKPRTGGDFGLDILSPSINHLTTTIRGVRIVTWGVPADPIHDNLRMLQGELRPALSETARICQGDFQTESTEDPHTMLTYCGNILGQHEHHPVPANSPPAPLLGNPTVCGKDLTATIKVVSYDTGVTHGEYPWPRTTGCELLSFNPSLAAQPTTTEADTPSGLDVELKVPQPQSTDVPSASEIKSLTVKLPEGFAINPNAADGKTWCTDEEAKIGTELEAQCPEFAKIGSLEIESATLPGPLPGYVYLGESKPGDRYRIVLTGDGFGVHVKILGSIRPDPATGGLTAVFPELPESPFEVFRMHMFGSERGSFSTPTQCGQYEVASSFVPWDDALPDQSSKQFFTIDSGPGGSPCPAQLRSFRPGLRAGSADNTAGAYTPFAFDLSRADGEQNLAALNVKTPPGFSGRIAGVPYCPEAALTRLNDPLYAGLTELGSPACPAASYIGSAYSVAGAGSRPLNSAGKVYLAGPYKGAPLSFVVVVPAVSGPYDLGNVVVRTAVYIDPTTAQLDSVTDRLPRIFGGIPLRLRELVIRLDRGQFTVNPTRCAPYAVDASVSGAEGGVAHLTGPFQVANCRNLPFGPKLSLRLSGKTKRVAYPALHARLTAAPGESNIAKTVVTMPHALFLENSHINAPCTRVQFAADECPKTSILGTARAETPLLDKPLEGNVYLRSSNHKLPDMVAALRGQVSLDLVGRVDSVKQRLRASFETVPDVPVTSFRLDLLGNKRGLLVNSENLCKANLRAVAKFVGQNRKSFKRRVAMKTPCGKARKK